MPETTRPCEVALEEAQEPLRPPAPAGWTFLTNHGHVLVALARDGDLRIRDLALAVGVTERTAQTVINDLVAAGYLERERVGTRSRYTVHHDLPLRHPAERDHSVGELLAIVRREPPAQS